MLYAALFGSRVFHLGCDETSVKLPMCTIDATKAIEVAVSEAVHGTQGFISREKWSAVLSRMDRHSAQNSRPIRKPWRHTVETHSGITFRELF